MNRMFNTRRIGAVAATLGTFVALGGASFALAQTGTDIVSRNTASIAETSEAASYAVLARSWVQWSYNADDPGPAILPQSRPRYSQVNFQTPAEGGGGSISVPEGHAGQAHAEASVLLQKGYGGGPATVTCDLRMTGEPMSSQYVVTLPREDQSRMTISLVGSRGKVPAGPHNIGVACWTAPGQPPVVMQTVDLHAVVYDEPS